MRAAGDAAAAGVRGLVEQPRRVAVAGAAASPRAERVARRRIRSSAARPAHATSPSTSASGSSRSGEPAAPAPAALKQRRAVVIVIGRRVEQAADHRDRDQGEEEQRQHRQDVEPGGRDHLDRQRGEQHDEPEHERPAPPSAWHRL